MESVSENGAVIFMADGFEEIEAVTVIDILRRAEIPVHIVSIMRSTEVIGAHGLRLMCDAVFDEASDIIDRAPALILPGGGEGTRNLKDHQGLCDVLKKAFADRKLLAAICAAPSVFGVLGILEGKAAVCYPGFENELSGAQLSAEAVVVSGDVITAKAAGCASDFAFKIVELIKDRDGKDGKKAAGSIKAQMFY